VQRPVAGAEAPDVGGPRQDNANEAGSWRARPVPAALLRAAIVLAPAVAALLVVGVLARVVPTPTTDQLALGLLRLGALVVTASAVAYAVERAVRRLSPMVMLLQMSLLFPGRAPSRFRLARKACTTDVREALSPRAGDDAHAVAERVVSLVAALSRHDRHTRGHSQRVQVLAEMLARDLGIATADRQRLRWAALLHDIGKLSVSAAVLTKPAKLDDAEWDQMRAHPTEGARLCGPLLDWLGEWGRAIPEHHERYDGTGYPFGLGGHDISTAGRLVCLVDAYETMTATRPYKRPMATRDARVELAKCAGSHFDPVMVRAFLAISVPRLLWASGPLSFVLQMPFLPLVQAGSRTAQAALTAAGTGIVAGGAAVVIITAAGPASPPVHPGQGSGSAGVVDAGGASAPGQTTGAGSGGRSSGTGGEPAGASPTGPVSAPTASATSSGTGGSGSTDGGTPAPGRSGLLPPLTGPLPVASLPGAITAPVASTVSSVLPSPVTSVVASTLPSPVGSLVDKLLPGLLGH
jgi:putative nucleotidyltransferase with HDIG domain